MTGHASHAGATTRAAQLGHDLGRWVPLPGGTALCKCRHCGLRVLDVGYTTGGSACSVDCATAQRLLAAVGTRR